MSDWEIIVLGAIAGFTIFLGLPSASSSSSCGTSCRPVSSRWKNLTHGSHERRRLMVARIGFSTLLTVCVTVGLVTLVYYDRWLRARSASRPEGPGAATGNSVAFRARSPSSASRRLAFLRPRLSIYAVLMPGSGAAQPPCDASTMTKCSSGDHPRTGGSFRRLLWSVATWGIAVPLSFAATAFPANLLGLITRNDIVDVLIGTGSSRYTRVA